MSKIKIALLSSMIFFQSALASSIEDEKNFSEKITKMLSLTEASLKAIRAQIVTSQGAPFLADLYLQLASFLMKKSNALYYVQKEKDKESESEFDDASLTRFPAVVDAQKEAAEILKKVISDFPKFNKRPQAMYLLAVCYNSIDNNAQFQIAAGTLIREYPDSSESLQVRVLLGQRAVRSGNLDDALQIFLKIKNVKPAYERNLAMHNIGRIYLRKEKFKEALTHFEQVIKDPELKDDAGSENEDQSSLSSSLKREALLDSIQAYPHVYEKNARPAEYYSNLSPTEPLALEIMEKLAFRYVYLKRYDEAVTLLRAIGKTIRDPGRVVNMYRDVLVLIPQRRRSEIAVEEVQYFFEKFIEWREFYEIPPEDLKSAKEFYEVQLRELGTTSHDAAKREQDPTKKEKLLERARRFYILYLGFFEKSPLTIKIATNLADVYALQKKYLDSGEYYLRLFSGDFGMVENKKELIENSLRALEKTNEESFYYQLRSRGLIIRAIRSYLAFEPQQKSNYQLRFLYAKTLYEQGLFDDALPNLLEYMKTFPQSKYTSDAGDLILDHYNVIEDFEGLQKSCKSILALNLPDKAYNAKVTKIGDQSKLKRIESVIKEKSGPAVSAKDFLGAALGLGDKELQSVALAQALARSKKEGDIDTFLKSAISIADQESDAGKRGEILMSAASEAVKVTKYYQAMTIFAKVAEMSTASAAIRGKAAGLGLTTALWLRDWDKVSAFQMMSASANLPSEIRQGLTGQVWEALENPITLPQSIIKRAVEKDSQSAEFALALFKAGQRAFSPEVALILKQAAHNCGSNSSSPFCAWGKITALEDKYNRIATALSKGPFNMANLQVRAREFQGVSAAYVELSDTGDEHLDQFSSVRAALLYQKFSGFLNAVRKANPALNQVLTAKANEAEIKSKRFFSECAHHVQTLERVSPASRACVFATNATFDDLMQWPVISVVASPKSDPAFPAQIGLQKKLFSDPGNADAFFALATSYAEKGNVHHALAAATQGLSMFRARENEWKGIMGCELPKVGLLTQAAALLHKLSGTSRCKQEVLQMVLKK